MAGDAQVPPFASSQFAAAFTESANVFLDRPLVALRESVRMIMPGGYVGITELLWESGSEDAVNTLLRALGVVPYRLDDWRALTAEAGLTGGIGEEHWVNMSREA